MVGEVAEEDFEEVGLPLPHQVLLLLLLLDCVPLLLLLLLLGLHGDGGSQIRKVQVVDQITAVEGLI